MDNKDLAYDYERACMEFLHVNKNLNSFLWENIPLLYLQECGYINEFNRSKYENYAKIKQYKINPYADFGLDGLSYEEEGDDKIFYGVQCKYRDSIISTSDLGSFYASITALKCKNPKNSGILITKTDKLDHRVRSYIEQQKILHIVYNPDLSLFAKEKKEEDELNYFADEKPDFTWEFVKGLQIISIPYHVGNDFIINSFIFQVDIDLIIIADKYVDKLKELHNKVTGNRKTLFISGDRSGTTDNAKIINFLKSKEQKIIFTTIHSLYLCIDYTDCIIINDAKYIEKSQTLMDKVFCKSGLIITKFPNNNFIQSAKAKNITYIDRHENIFTSIESKKSANVFIFEVSKYVEKLGIEATQENDINYTTHSMLELDDTIYATPVRDAVGSTSPLENALLQGVIDTNCRKCICFLQKWKSRELALTKLKILATQRNIEICTNNLSYKDTKKEKKEKIDNFRKSDRVFSFLFISSNENLKNIPEADGVFISGVKFNKLSGKGLGKTEQSLYKKIQISSMISKDLTKLNKILVYSDVNDTTSKVMETIYNVCHKNNFNICHTNLKKYITPEINLKYKETIEDKIHKIENEPVSYEVFITKLQYVLNGNKVYEGLDLKYSHKLQERIIQSDSIHQFFNKNYRYPEYKKGEKIMYKKLQKVLNENQDNLLSDVEKLVFEKLPYWEWQQDVNKWIDEISKAKYRIVNKCFVDYNFSKLVNNTNREKELQEIKEKELEMVSENWEYLCNNCYQYKHDQKVFEYMYEKICYFHGLLFTEIDQSFKNIINVNIDKYVLSIYYDLHVKYGYTSYEKLSRSDKQLNDFSKQDQQIIEEKISEFVERIENKVKMDLNSAKFSILQDEYIEGYNENIDCILKKEIKENENGEIAKIYHNFLSRKLEKEKLKKLEKEKLEKENIEKLEKKINEQNMKKLQLHILWYETIDFSKNDTDFEKWCNKIYNNRNILSVSEKQTLEDILVILKLKSFHVKKFFTKSFPINIDY